MNLHFVFLFLCFTVLKGYAQQTDSLKHSQLYQEADELKLNQETREAIRNKTLIGPLPERQPLRRIPENEPLTGLSGNKLRNETTQNKDSIFTHTVSEHFIKQMKAEERIFHKKTTVNDTQTLANPHIKVSFNDILCYLFRPDLRNKMRNTKQAMAYKSY